MKWLFVFFTLVLTACKPNSGKSNPEQPEIPSQVALTDVSTGGCLNLEKLSRIFQNPAFSVPAAMMTIDLKSIGEIPQSKLNYFSFATFNYRIANINQMGLFNQVRQKDCKTVQMLSASEEVLTFKVTDFNEKEITIKLVEKFRDSLNTTHKQALMDRQQPFEYSFKYINSNQMEILQKYTTVDAICTSKNPLTFEIRKALHWAGRFSALPKKYGIQATYLNQVKESLMPEEQSQFNAIESSDDISVDMIRLVMHLPLKAELKLCAQ